MLAKPSSLTRASYDDPTIFEMEQTRLFARSWHFVGFADELNPQGGSMTRTIGGFPIVIVNFEGEWRAFLNVCSHRFAPLRSPQARPGPLRCPYHGWTYDGEGVPVGIPCNETAFALSRSDRQALALRRFALQWIGPMAFVRVSEEGPDLTAAAGTFLPWLRDAAEGFAAPFAQGAMTWVANWKQGIENVLEVYHVDAVHPDSFRTVVDGRWHTRSTPPHSLSHAGLRPQAQRWWARAEKQFRLHRVGSIDDYQHLVLFPNLAVGITAGLMASFQTFEPVAPDRFILRYRLSLAKSTGGSAAGLDALKAHLAALNERLLAEDQAICEAVAIGQRHANRPALLGANEERLRDFHATWTAHLEKQESNERASSLP
jgi:choline monooxygenase